MFIYDATSIAFIQKTQQFLREILRTCGIEVRQTRFSFHGYLWPVQVVIFEGKEWGHFNHAYLQIGLNKKLIYQAKDSVVRDLLKHELAHYLTYILHGEVGAHGKEFLEVCSRFGFPGEISAATMDLTEANTSREGDIDAERVLEKVKKLLSLAGSSNAHEAELATLKANDLLLRHNLDYLNDREEPIYLDRLLMRKRKDAKLTAIYSILKHFVVRPVISQGTNACCLEVSGSLTNVKLAGYVANFLDLELDHLWEEARSEFGLHGLRAKNSFFVGVAGGFDEKMKVSRKNYSVADQKALVVVEKRLEAQTRQIYRRLQSSRSGLQTDAEASSAGHQKGLSLTVRSAVEGTAKNLYLPFRKS